jgi:hypothetical protein
MEDYMKKRFWIAALAVLITLTITACPEDDNNDSGPAISTINFEPDGNGFYQFYTNDSRYYGYALWSIAATNINGAANTYQIECKKISGAGNYPYGMVFGVADNNNRQYYSLTIDTNGYYYIAKLNGDNFTEIKEWTFSNKLHTGYNVINTLKVTKNGITFTIYFNNDSTQIHTFTDSEISGNRVGLTASVGAKTAESFPDRPVDIRFRQTN